MKDFEEIIMDDDSDEELENIIEPNLSSSDEETMEEEEVEDNFRPSRPGDSPNIFNFTPPFTGINRTLININAKSSAFSIFNLFFKEITRILLLETNRYFHQFSSHQDTPIKPPDVPLEELYKFFALIIEMGHNQRDTIRDYWCEEEQYYTPFYHKTMLRERFFHILRFIHFSDNNNAPNKQDSNYDKLWKIRNIFDKLNNKFGELYYPTEHIAIDEITGFKEREIFRQYNPKTRKKLKIYKLCDSLGYTYDMSVYSGQQSQLVDKNISATHALVLQLVRRIEGVGHKLYMDNYFSSPILFDDLLTRKINSCGTVRYNRRQMPQDIGQKLKKGDIVTRIKGNLSAVRWKDKRDVYLLTNIHSPPVAGNFIDESSNAIKPRVIEDYNTNMGYIEQSNQMANRYGVAKKTWKWPKKLFFHLLDLTIVNAFILHKSVGGNMSHKKFREALSRELIIHANELNVKNIAAGRARPSLATGKLPRLEVNHSKHWPSKCKRRRCRVCSLKNKRTNTPYCCKHCDVGLCVDGCFEIWHTRVKF